MLGGALEFVLFMRSDKPSDMADGFKEWKKIVIKRLTNLALSLNGGVWVVDDQCACSDDV